MTWLEAQNTDRALTFRAASDTYWCDVQRLRVTEFCSVVLLPAILAVIAQFHVAVVTATDLIAFALTILDAAIIYPLIATYRSKGAAAQNDFDAIVYQLPSPAVKYVDEEDSSEIHAAARRQNSKRAVRNRDWYSPELGTLPLKVGRLACLRETVAWDGGLRWRYVVALGAAFVFTAISIVIYATIDKMTMPDLIARVLYPLIPAIVWISRETWDQRDSARRADALRSRVARTWQHALGGNINDADLEGIASAHQYHVFAYRERTSPVPDALYGLLRKSRTVSASDAAKDAVQDYQRSATAP